MREGGGKRYNPSPMAQEAAQPPHPPSPLLRLALEGGPLLVFFVTNRLRGIYAGTAVFMVAIVLALCVSWRRERRLPIMPLVTAVFVLIFGGLTLYFSNESFIKLKPTIVNCLFAGALFVGLAFNKSFLHPLLGHTLALSRAGWRILTWRWAFFFVFLACLNEVIWRSFSTDFWVSFKAWGMFPITLLFALSQVPLIQRHALEAPQQG